MYTCVYIYIYICVLIGVGGNRRHPGARLGDSLRGLAVCEIGRRLRTAALGASSGGGNRYTWDRWGESPTWLYLGRERPLQRAVPATARPKRPRGTPKRHISLSK